MIPLWAIVRVRGDEGRGFGLWLPLFLLWLFLLPFAVLLSPIFLIACLVTWVSPLRVLGVCWEIVSSLRGTKIDVADGRRLVFISIH